MHPEILALVALVDEAERHLRSHGQVFWADWLAGDAARVRAGDFHGLTHLLSAFGGMGSLSDVVLDETNVVQCLDATRTTNERLSELLHQMYELARALASTGR